MNALIELEQQFGAHNYAPLPVVLTKGEGIYLWDDEGNQYMDMMGAYSAVSHGHVHPKITQVAKDQMDQLAIVSRAYYSDKLAPFLQRVCELTKQEKALPMNTGVEAVETALKAARKWAYTIKGVAKDKAEIIVCDGNFHGRTIAIVGMSSEEQYKDGFGPFPKGFKNIPYGDAEALQNAINENTAAFLVEPIQGEGGIVIPPQGYLSECAKICKDNNVLFIADEIQCGLGRTGKLLACDHEDVIPDGLILGKALGGGVMPVSMFLARKEVMDVFTPGDHGSTFGGNPLASVVGLEALNVLVEEELTKNSAELGDYLLNAIKQIDSPMIKDVRGKGLFIGVEIDPNYATAREICLKLLDQGILSKETHETVVRLAPPLVITKQQVDVAIEKIKKVIV